MMKRAWEWFKKKTGFEVKHDLNRLIWDFHNKGHYYGSMVMALGAGIWLGPVRGFLISYSLWFLWEIFDGFKPWWHDEKYAHWYYMPQWYYRLATETLLSDKFSTQDAFHWDLRGAAWGALVAAVLKIGWYAFTLAGSAVATYWEVFRVLW